MVNFLADKHLCLWKAPKMDGETAAEYQQKHMEHGSSEHYRSAVLIAWPSYNRIDYYDPGISQWWDTRGLLSSLVYIKHHQHNSMSHSIFFKTIRFVFFAPISLSNIQKSGSVYRFHFNFEEIPVFCSPASIQVGSTLKTR